MVTQLSICLNAGFFREVGTYWTAFFLGKELVKRGHEVTLICISRNNRFTSSVSKLEGMTLIECPNLFNRPFILQGMGPLDSLRRLRTLVTHDFDIVHGFEHYLDVTMPVWFTKWFRSYIFISDWRDWFSKGMRYGRFGNFPGAERLLSLFEDQARRIAMGVTVGSRDLEKHVLGLGFPSDRVLLLHGGAPLDTVKPVPTNQARLAIGMADPDLKIIGFLSSTHSIGLNRFVQPLTRLFSEMPNLRFLMLGNPDHQFLQWMADEGWRDRIVVPGWVSGDQLPDYLGAADVFILALNNEMADSSRWPLKVGDYLAAGRPIVGTSVGDTPEILRNYGAGLVADTEAEITSALRSVLTNHAKAEDMGRRARNAADDVLSWSVRAQELEGFYEKLLAVA